METEIIKLTTENIEAVLLRLASVAWVIRENAYVLGKTKVGCAILSDDGRIFGGCNAEHRFRCHDIHAEVNAISSMVAAGGRHIKAVLIVAERDRFTPCGGCMDWIMQFGSESTVVAFQAAQNGIFQKYTAGQLMPHYPV
jgi:cytidine deaminase